MALKLYGVPLSPFARMAHAVAELTNNDFEYIKERLALGHFEPVLVLVRGSRPGIPGMIAIFRDVNITYFT